MRSESLTPTEYVASLPEDRRKIITKLRALLRKNLPKGFEERMAYGMLAYVVPHKLYPRGYHADPKQPLPFINLASQKQYVSLYHMGLYDGPLLSWLRAEWPKHTEMKLDVGKCCLRLKKLDQIPYELLGQLASRMTPQQWIEVSEAATKRA